ncbi:hypothetical protein VOLCADRAFT_107547 [Volvox carteri f. nagariensis]|uniref:Uncharacterized protein n=1 Tax=Volvox carteri f. nagariensis TaxID=3068 RepID=D8UER8_VOLCA|nr:uncharacterized protein VOLCADRAFT_107547 [Volvox carteri f. nagariensis]EFJ41778.1 hypothetical protein VOLCADRAFT_107547 [Volvox carteri f. nagariensis]|eukprot:XP_002957124.1 hypothetical protein VOLCADRAFT_107547 [Volvox carteri f. nagariensis]
MDAAEGLEQLFAAHSAVPALAVLQLLRKDLSQQQAQILFKNHQHCLQMGTCSFGQVSPCYKRQARPSWRPGDRAAHPERQTHHYTAITALPHCGTAAAPLEYRCALGMLSGQPRWPGCDLCVADASVCPRGGCQADAVINAAFSRVVLCVSFLGRAGVVALDSASCALAVPCIATPHFGAHAALALREQQYAVV